MSKFKLLAVAIAATLAAPAAFAGVVTLTGGTGPEILPSNAFFDATSLASNPTRAVNVLATASSVYLGRTAPYIIRLNLSQGLFSADPTTPLAVGGTGTRVKVGGTGSGLNTVSYTITPAGTGVAVGDGIQFAATGITINGVAALGAPGSTLSATAQVFDPNTSTQLGSDSTVILVRTIEGWVVTFTPGVNTQRIDVGSPSLKRFFGTGTVGTAVETTVFNAGRVAVITNTTLTSVLTLNLATATAPVNIFGADLSPFKTITGGTGGSVYLATAAGCPTGGSIAATVAINNLSAAIAVSTTAAAVNTAGFLCFDSNAITNVNAQTLSSSLAVAQASHNAGPTVTSTSTTLENMQFNGSNADVSSFNPGTNTSIVSFLRVSNTSLAPGKLSITPTCDTGLSPGTAVVTSIAAGRSVLIEAAHLELGGGVVATGAGSCGAGVKSRLSITGEFDGMRVQNFMRHNTSVGVVTNNVNNAN